LADSSPFATQRAQFAARGFAVFEGVLVGEALDLLRRECGGFIAREDARMDAAGVDRLDLSHRGRRYFANECQRERPELRKVLFGETMAGVCRATLGDEAYFFMDQFVVKGAEDGLPFGWHQDSGYMAYNGGPADHAPYLTCWCTLDDATVDNGTVRLAPFPAAPHSRDAIVHHRRDLATNDLVADAPEAAAIPVEAPAGSIVAFSSRLLHATGANRTDRLRRVYLAQYTPEAILNPGTRRLRRNAIVFLRDGRRVTLP
jgi:ectoine hydroxylase-related dioxygenase (phytanoyl-CoA dioxygenase family)